MKICPKYLNIKKILTDSFSFVIVKALKGKETIVDHCLLLCIEVFDQTDLPNGEVWSNFDSLLVEWNISLIPHHIQEGLCISKNEKYFL